MSKADITLLAVEDVSIDHLYNIVEVIGHAAYKSDDYAFAGQLLGFERREATTLFILGPAQSITTVFAPNTATIKILRAPEEPKSTSHWGLS